MSNLTDGRGTCSTAICPTTPIPGNGTFWRCELDDSAELPPTADPAAVELTRARRPESGDSDELGRHAD